MKDLLLDLDCDDLEGDHEHSIYQQTMDVMVTVGSQRCEMYRDCKLTSIVNLAVENLDCKLGS